MNAKPCNGTRCYYSGTGNFRLASATWTSLNPNIATIDANGMAVAAASEQVTIAAEVIDLVAYALLTVSIPSAAPVASWNTTTSGTSDDFKGVWGTSPSPSDVYAVHAGPGGGVFHYEGTSWSTVVTSQLPSLAVCGTSSSDVFVMGSAAGLLHYDGTAWSSTTIAVPAAPRVKFRVVCKSI